jgi:hypothetical protein
MSETPGFFDWRKLNEAYSFKFDPAAKYPDPDFGLPQGRVDSGKAGYGGENNDWGGSMQRALAFAKIANEFSGKDIITSQKRSRVKTGKGTVSDHYQGNNNAYAIDLSCKGDAGDRLLAHLMEWFGYPNYTGGYWLNVNKGGYRYQFGWKVKDHFDHIHIGVKKTKSKDTPLNKKQIINPLPQQSAKIEDGSVIYKEERGDPYEYKVIDGIWWTKGPEIPEWKSLDTNREANDILDARYGVRTPEQIKNNELLYSRIDKDKNSGRLIDRLFKRRGKSYYVPGKHTTISIPEGMEGPVSIFVFYPGIKVNGEIGKVYMPPLIKEAVPDWYRKYVIVIPNENTTPWEDVQDDIKSVLSENDMFSKGISIGIFSGSGNNRSSGIVEYLTEIRPSNLLLMDPTPGSKLNEAVEKLGSKTQTILVYNPSAWKGYKWYPESIEKLKDSVISVGICEKTSTPHMEIPGELLKNFRRIIEKKA